MNAITERYTAEQFIAQAEYLEQYGHGHTGQLLRQAATDENLIARITAEATCYKAALIDIEDITRDELDISGGIKSQANDIARNALKEG